MHLVNPLESPKVACYGTNYKLYLEHYKLYRDYVESQRQVAAARNRGADEDNKKAAKPKPKPNGPTSGTAFKTPLTPEQLAGRKAHQRGVRRAKRERRKIRKLEAKAKIADLEKKVASSKKVVAQASLAETKAKAEVPLAATKVQLAKGKYMNAAKAALYESKKLDNSLATEDTKAQVAVVKTAAAKVNAVRSLEEARIKLRQSVPATQWGSTLKATQLAEAILESPEQSIPPPPPAFGDLHLPLGTMNATSEGSYQDMTVFVPHQPSNQRRTTQTTQYDARGRVTGRSESIVEF